MSDRLALMESPPPQRRRTGSLEELRAELDDFERRYGHPSGRLDAAFTRDDGSLDETADFHRWSQVYAAWQSATASQR